MTPWLVHELRGRGNLATGDDAVAKRWGHRPFRHAA